MATSSTSRKKDVKTRNLSHLVPENQPIDLLGAKNYAANKKLCDPKIYGEGIHNNPGGHLHGGIGKEMDPLHSSYLQRLMCYQHHFYLLLRGKIDKTFTPILTDLIDGIGPDRRQWNSEYYLLFILLMLYKKSNVNSSSDIKKLLKRRLERWENPDNLKVMVLEAELEFKHRQTKLLGDMSHEELAKAYASICNRYSLSKAIRFITDRDGGRVLSPTDVVNPVDNTMVEDVLLDKRPPLRDMKSSSLKEYPSVPEIPEVVITDGDVEEVAKKLSGSAGLVGFDSSMMQNILLQHGGASAKLRQSVAKLATWISNENVFWVAYRGLMMCRELALDKMPGVCPLGIGDILRRLIATCVLRVMVDQAVGACGTDNLCSGLKLGCEGGIHSMSALWDDLSKDDGGGFLIGDGNNSFNELSRFQMLWMIRHKWPTGAWFAFNCYKHWSILLTREPGGSKFLIIYSQDNGYVLCWNSTAHS